MKNRGKNKSVAFIIVFSTGAGHIIRISSKS